MTDSSSPLFSVVIPVYNRAGLISDTLESVFAQEYSNYEIIVVDDGSTDATVEVVKNYGDRVTLIKQENKGPGSARNAGVKCARGTYVTFLDSDDLWFPWTLEVYREVIDSYCHPSFISGILFPFHDIEDLCEVEKSSIRVSAYEDYLKAAGLGVYVGTGMACIKRTELVRVGGLSEKNINAEDHDLALRLGVSPTFVVVDEPYTVAQRIHEDKLMANHDKTFRGIRNLISNEAQGIYPGGSQRIVERRAIICQHVRSSSVDLLNKGEFIKSTYLYRDTICWHMVQGRWKYLIGFPLLVGYRLVQGMK